MLERQLTKTKYITGNQMTIADLSAACELEQICFIALDISKDYPNVHRWLRHMIDDHEIMRELHVPV